MPGTSAQLAAAIDKYGRGQRSLLVVYPANHRSFKVTLEPAMSGSGIFAARIPAESVADGGGLSAAGWTLEELDRMGNFYRRHFLADGGSPEAVASAIEQAYALLGLPAAIGSWVVWPRP